MEDAEKPDPLPRPEISGQDEDDTILDKRSKLNRKSAILNVGIAYNLKKGIKSDVEDYEAEYDSIETVFAIEKAIRQLNCRVELLEADDSFFDRLQKARVDIVFNIAEGRKGRGREAQIPAILNYLGIPYTGSDETTLCIALDKALSKRILSTFKIKTPRYQLITSKNSKIDTSLRYPLIAKPNAEGSSKGISDYAIAHNIQQLRDLIDRNFDLYKQPMLVEEYIQGREFTVGIIGNGEDTVVFPPMEIRYKNQGNKFNIYSYNVKQNYKKYIEYICPAQLENQTYEKVIKTARKIYDVLECKDFSRVDFRMSEDGEIYFIEINPLPGLAPGYSDYPMIAQFTGIDYAAIIKMILNSGLKRYGMKQLD